MTGRPKVSDSPAVLAIAAELGVTAGQVALAWLLAGYDKTLLIPGTSSAAHLAENLAAGEVTLPESAIATLDRLAPDVPRKESQP
jgi:aryl-alcohol dehydrogenase-like predicted oxidoreductase